MGRIKVRTLKFMINPIFVSLYHDKFITTRTRIVMEVAKEIIVKFMKREVLTVKRVAGTKLDGAATISWSPKTNCYTRRARAQLTRDVRT